MIPLEKPKLLPLTKPEQTPGTKNVVGSNSIAISTTSSSSTGLITENTTQPLPLGSALEALIGKKIQSLPPTNVATTPNKNNAPIDIKKKNSPIVTTDVDEDTSDIKTPLMSPQTPVAPMPTVLELKIPPSPAKPLSGK